MDLKEKTTITVPISTAKKFREVAFERDLKIYQLADLLIEEEMARLREHKKAMWDAEETA